MRKQRGLVSAILGLTVGLLLGFIILNHRISTPSVFINRFNFTLPTNMDASELREKQINASSSNLLFVGVMTAQKYLGDRAKAVYETWGKEVPGKIMFFASEFSTVPENCPDLPLVSLPRVDDSYPPQKKSFLMLQYMWNNFGDKFEWFLRADDDVYVRTDKLEKFLRSVDSKKPMYIGQAGRGNSEEFGLLSLEYDENFCMGGPGAIFSRETLRRIVPQIKNCLKNLYTTHEDVELGRCVKKYAGVSCTWSYEMQSILYHNSSGDQAFTGKLKRKEVHRAITLHPVKSPPHMYRIHNYMRGLKIQNLQQKKILLHRDIHSSISNLGVKEENIENYTLAEGVSLFPQAYNLKYSLGKISTLGVPPSLRSFKPRSSDEVIPWNFFARSEYSLEDSNPRRRLHSDLQEGLKDITREVMVSINACSRQRGRTVEERAALYGYQKVDYFGADTILDLLLIYRKYRGKKATLPVRRHVYLHQHFTGLEIREVIDGTEVDRKTKNSSKSLQNIFPGLFLGLSSSNRISDPIHRKIIHFILPLSGRYEIFKRFLKNYEEVCIKGQEKTKLLVILFRHVKEDSFSRTINLISQVKSRFPNAEINVIPCPGNFSRAKGLEVGVNNLKSEDLMFFVDVDIVFTRSALIRIRLNTIINLRIYFPIVFSQFDPNIVNGNQRNENMELLIDHKSGYWRQYGFGIVALYKTDFKKVGGFDLTIQGWGKEDVDFFEKAVKSNLEVFRAPDRNLIHVYHEVECDSELSSIQLLMCKGSKADTYAGTEQLADIIYRNPDYLRFAKLRRFRNSKPGE